MSASFAMPVIKPSAGACAVRCDRCYEISTFSASRDEIARVASELGWSMWDGDNGEYEHICPDCRRKQS